MNKLDILPRKTMSIQNFLLKQTLKKKKKNPKSNPAPRTVLDLNVSYKHKIT